MRSMMQEFHGLEYQVSVIFDTSINILLSFFELDE